MRKLIKVCGIRTVEEAVSAADAGADMIGLVFAPASKRRVTAQLAEACRAELRGAVPIVGVFQDQPVEEVRTVRAAGRLDLVQLHGDEDPDYCAAVGAPVLKRLRPADLARREAFAGCRILIDPGSGDGIPIDWRGLGPFCDEFVAGGLNPDNVGDVIRLVRPSGVDVSSGVEVAGSGKDIDKMIRFVVAARAAWGSDGQGGASNTCGSAAAPGSAPADGR